MPGHVQITMDGFVPAGAELSDDRVYRYLLWRTWDPLLPPCLFVGLNPSTADETEDDNTIRKCVKFAKRWGYGSLHMANVFAFRATDPRDVPFEDLERAIGPDNDERLSAFARSAGLIVAAWGANLKGLARREAEVIALLTHANPALHCLAVTKDGHPGHPLYLSDDTQPQIFCRRKAA